MTNRYRNIYANETQILFFRHQSIPFNVHLAINEQFISGNTVTVMSPEGKPIQMNAMALQMAAAQNAAGVLGRAHIENCMKYFVMRNSRF